MLYGVRRWGLGFRQYSGFVGLVVFGIRDFGDFEDDGVSAGLALITHLSNLCRDKGKIDYIPFLITNSLSCCRSLHITTIIGSWHLKSESPHLILMTVTMTTSFRVRSMYLVTPA